MAVSHLVVVLDSSVSTIYIVYWLYILNLGYGFDMRISLIKILVLPIINPTSNFMKKRRNFVYLGS